MYKVQVFNEYSIPEAEIVLSFNIDLISQSDCDDVLTSIIDCDHETIAPIARRLKSMFNLFRDTARGMECDLRTVKSISMDGIHIDNASFAGKKEYHVKIYYDPGIKRCEDTWPDIMSKYVYIGLAGMGLAYLFSRTFK
jgi:hypothetical protein